MWSYCYVKVMTDNDERGLLDIWRECNTFHVYEYGNNVFTGSYCKTIEFINNWKDRKNTLIEGLRNLGMNIGPARFEQTIR